MGTWGPTMVVSCLMAPAVWFPCRKAKSMQKYGGNSYFDRTSSYLLDTTCHELLLTFPYLPSPNLF